MDGESLPPKQGKEVEIVKKRRGKSSFTHRKSGTKGGRPRKSNDVVVSGDSTERTVRLQSIFSFIIAGCLEISWDVVFACRINHQLIILMQAT